MVKINHCYSAKHYRDLCQVKINHSYSAKHYRDLCYGKDQPLL